MASDEKTAHKQLDQFLALVPQIDGKALKRHRDWILAHSTMKKAPAVLYREVWEAADKTLMAVDCLSRFALGRQENLQDRSRDRQEQSQEFWARLISEEKEPV